MKRTMKTTIYGKYIWYLFYEALHLLFKNTDNSMPDLKMK